jgi:hypothetical protein
LEDTELAAGFESQSSLKNALNEYHQSVSKWIEESKKELDVLKRFQKAISEGDFKAIERLWDNARNCSQQTRKASEKCSQFCFDVKMYLGDDGLFFPELKELAAKNGLKLYELDGVGYCYPVTIKCEPELFSIRINNKRELKIHPDRILKILKDIQKKESKFKPQQFIEILFDAYKLESGRRKSEKLIDVPLVNIYSILTLLPGSKKEYDLLDFSRDLYFLDKSGLTTTSSRARMDLIGSTGGREKIKRIKCITPQGQTKEYQSIIFALK